MSQLTIPAALDRSVMPACAAGVWIDDRRRHDLVVLHVEQFPGPQFGQATVAVHEAAAQKIRRPSPESLPAIGCSAVIATGPGGADVLLYGVVVAHGVQMGDDGEQFTARIAHRFSRLFNESLTRRYHHHPSGPVEVADVSVRFNTDATALASQLPVTLNGRVCRLFDAGLTAQPWTVADALAYLLAAYGPQDVEAPSLDQLADLAGPLELASLDLTGRSVYDALATVAGQAGLCLRSSADGCTLVFYRPGRDGPCRRICLQAPGQSLHLDRTNLYRGAIAFARRPARPTLLLLGGRKRFEATLSLQGGWDPQVIPSRWRDTVRSLSGDWPTYADVFRKWVLNEHGWYSGPPWQLPVCDFQAVSADDFLVQAPRPLLPCLSTSPAGQSLGVVVELRLDTDQPWRRWRGPLWVSQAQAAIYLGGDALPADYYEAALAGLVQMRLTAIVQADTRLSLRVAGDPGCPAQVVEMPSARWARVSGTSIFYQLEGLGPPAECDDSPLFCAYVEAQAPLAAQACQARLTLGWIDPVFMPGDLIERVQGRPLELRGSTDLAPYVASVRHDFQNQFTELLVEG